ncbi:SafA/ExsA family spore coat assembly protein [Mesobacillus subterraneus]|uniref:SafA/ExsA family spore coat assembly protein n=1 Tax=Mesobacillus subterraneus TaxID=285983 RepID=UPI00203D29C9|nr:SafA/ExsA family spore coat assembly protein [Mesobacillus subterraneus]MCM3665274.1 SafA/ExsA family spore coat assembly protein [Mesobacillus subterraneus]MCM3684287.1 SafA/ExsA family spore coat assembly protein [Mesobacillus subterraneus]
MMGKKVILAILLLFWLVPAMSFAQQVYTVQAGDTMWKISVRYQIGLSEIIAANPQIKNPNLIYPGQKIDIPSLGAAKSIDNEVIRLTNAERAKHGLTPLTADWELSRAARYKSFDMRDKNYFSHTSPTYGSPFNMIRSFGVNYRSAAENIAAGQRTANEVVQAWMNSPGHRQNILNASYTHMGSGYASGGAYGHYWTQLFISK